MSEIAIKIIIPKPKRIKQKSTKFSNLKNIQKLKGLNSSKIEANKKQHEIESKVNSSGIFIPSIKISIDKYSKF